MLKSSSTKAKLSILVIFAISVLLHFFLLKSWKNDANKSAAAQSSGKKSTAKSDSAKAAAQAKAAAIKKAMAAAKAKREALKKLQEKLKKAKQKPKEKTAKVTPNLPKLKGEVKPIQTTSNDAKLKMNDGAPLVKEAEPEVLEEDVTEVEKKIQAEQEELKNLEEIVKKTQANKIVKLRVVEQDPNKKAAFYLSIQNQQDQADVENKELELKEKKKDLEKLKKDLEKKQDLKKKQELEKKEKELLKEKQDLEKKKKELELAKKKELAEKKKKERELKNKQKKAKAKKQDLASKMKRLRDSKKVVVKSKITKSQHTSMLRSMNIGRMKGVPVPQLVQSYRDTPELLAVHSYFAMKVIAYRRKDPRNVIVVEGLNSNAVNYQKVDGFNFRNYGSRHFPRTASFFQKHHQHIENQKLLGEGETSLVTVVPVNVDSYFRYKQLEVIKRSGHKADDVARVISSFQKTSFGSWILKIEHLQLRDGKTIDVEDFEYQEITGG